MKAYDTSFLMNATNLELKKKSNFRAKIIFAVTKITSKFSQNNDYLGEYLTDFSKRGLE